VKQRHVQDMASHNESQQFHVVEVVAHTSLLRIVEEVYASIPNSYGKNSDLPAPRKVIKVHDVV
jgi:hypothetical protein